MTDAEIIREYLKDNELDAYVFRSARPDRVFVRVRREGGICFDIFVWPSTFVDYESPTMKKTRFILPHIESPNYAKELKDMIAKMK